MTDYGTPSDVPKSGRVSAWLSEIDDAYNGEGMSKYEDRCRVIRKRYRYEGSAFVRTRKYQLLWSNIETMKSAVYAKPPRAVVSRRYRDADPIGRAAVEILERTINFSFDASDFDSVFKQVRDDFLLYARGVARIYYEPEYETENDLNEDIEDAEEDRSPNLRGTSHIGMETNDVAPRRAEPLEEPTSGSDQKKALAFENVRIRFVQRADFRHQRARTWEEVQWVAFRAFLTRAEITKRFGAEIGEAIGLDSDPAETDDNERPASNPGAQHGPKATVWEIWDKAKNQVLWIAKSWPDVLEEGPPYLDLEGFYPCPRPAYGTLTPDSLVPVPDYVFYQDQGEEIDQLTARIGALSDALKLVGFYPSGPQGEGSPEIEKAFSAGFENKMIAVQAWDSFRAGGTSGGPPVAFLPMDPVINCLEGCVKLRQQLVEDVYQIMGIPDIMRGATDPQETEGAQQLKSQYAGTRVRDRQQEIARFCRDMARLCGQVLASYCSPTTLQKMSNVTLPTQAEVIIARLQAQQPIQGAAPDIPTQEAVFGLLKNPLTRRFKIDIENDSTVAGDESQERQDRSGFIEAVTKFMEAWGPMVIQKPELAPLAAQLLLFGVRAFRVGRDLEETIEETATKLQASPPQQSGGGADPAMLAKMQAEQMKMQATQARTASEIQKAQIEAEAGKMTASARMQEILAESEAKLAELRMKVAAAEQAHQHKTLEADLDHRTQLAKMELAAQQTAMARPPLWPVNEPGF